MTKKHLFIENSGISGKYPFIYQYILGGDGFSSASGASATFGANALVTLKYT